MYIKMDPYYFTTKSGKLLRIFDDGGIPLAEYKYTERITGGWREAVKRWPITKEIQKEFDKRRAEFEESLNQVV